MTCKNICAVFKQNLPTKDEKLLAVKRTTYVINCLENGLYANYLKIGMIYFISRTWERIALMNEPTKFLVALHKTFFACFKT